MTMHCLSCKGLIQPDGNKMSTLHHTPLPALDESFVVLRQSTENINSSHHPVVPLFNQTSSTICNASSMVNQASIMEQTSQGHVQLTLPTCCTCVKSMVDAIDKELSQIRIEKRLLYTFQNNANNEQEKNESTITTTSLFSDVNQLQQNLILMENEKVEIKETFISLENEMNQVLSLEVASWEEGNVLHEEYENIRKERDILVSHVIENEKEIRKIRASNVYNTAYYIWHDGPFGTINGFRLGQLLSTKVEWNEINTAWGEATLLLSRLSDEMKITFPKYRLIPLSNVSKVTCLLKPFRQYDLHGNATSCQTKDSFFNCGMVAWLQCLSYFVQWAERQDSKIRLPYAINEECIGTLSIRYYGEQNGENWTKACKFVLTNLKWMLAWCFKRQRMK